MAEPTTTKEAEIAAAQAAGGSKSGQKVTVACKLPHGLVLRVFEFEETQEPVMGGGTRTAKRAVQRGPRVVINGNATDRGPNPRLKQVVDGTGANPGYALTHNVDKDFFDAWLKQNADSDVVVNKLIFAASQPDRVADKAREMVAIKSGLEPVDPANLPKGGRLKIETATDGPQ